MKVAMLLVSILFLATAVEALPGGGGRQLAWDPRAGNKGKKCKASKVDVCWRECKQLEAEPMSIVQRVLGPSCTITFMDDCLDVGGCAGVEGKKKKKCCKKQCKESATKKSCIKSCINPSDDDDGGDDDDGDDDDDDVAVGKGCAGRAPKNKQKCCKKKCKKQCKKTPTSAACRSCTESCMNEAA